MDYYMKSGIGYYDVQLGNLAVGAVVALNSLGDIFDWKTGKKIAGLLAENKKDFRSSDEVLYRSYVEIENRFIENTALAVVFTNAEFDKTKLCKNAEMAHNGFSHSIRPVHTSADWDSIYAVSLGNLKSDIDVVGSLASRVISEAIISAIAMAESVYGFKAAKDLKFLFFILPWIYSTLNI